MRAFCLGRWTAVALWTAVILLSSSDSFASTETGGVLARLLGPHVSAETLATINFLIRKAAHVVAYGILGALAWRAAGRAGVAMLIVLVVATVDEWHQSTTALRSGSPWDVLLDLAGAAIAISLGLRWQSRRVRR
ncbi:MAG TPA: VanZ family protein [Thermoanaerobaculia bacterium]